MIEKSEYYHGAAIASLLQNEDLTLRKKGLLGYIVDDKVFVFLKYRTNPTTPWRFAFDQEDVNRCNKMVSEYGKAVVGLVCAGDGVCGLTWNEVNELLGSKAGWVCAQRKHNKSYGVTGQEADLKNKVALSRWSTIISELI